MEKRYNVYIVSMKDGEAVELIGENMRAVNADRRVMTGLSRIDTDNYFVGDYEVGSDKDLKFADDIKNNK